MDLDKSLNLDLSKFPLFDLVKIAIILFSLFLLYLYLLLSILSFSFIFSDDYKYFVDFFEVVLKVSSLAILLKP